MRVLLKLELDCEVDAAWRAIRSPTVLSAVSFPFTSFESLEQGGFPPLWPEGDHLVQVRALGLWEVGQQVIGVRYPAQRGDVQVMRDAGGGISGPLALVTRWQHTMAVSPLPNGRTLYRDQLVFGAGPLTVALWPVYWAFWQWRAFGLRRLAPGWR